MSTIISGRSLISPTFDEIKYFQVNVCVMLQANASHLRLSNGQDDREIAQIPTRGEQEICFLILYVTSPKNSCGNGA